MDTKRDLIIVGAGPSGLSCAIEAMKAGLRPIILEKGSLVDYIRRFPSNLIWFSTPELLEIGNVPFVISSVRPTRVDVLNYYQKVVQHYGLEIRYFDAVDGINREAGGFVVSTVQGKKYSAPDVVVATGYFDTPNRLDVPGESLPLVRHYYDEPYAYFDADVVIVGGRNSAVEAALDLYRHGARVTLVHRGERLSEGVKYWILPDIENRIKASQVKAVFSSRVREIRPNAVLLDTPTGSAEVKADFVFVLIGFRPDSALLRKFGIETDAESLGPRSNAVTLETNIPGLYVAGSVVAGKFNNKIFVENGRLHGAQIVKAILSKRSSSMN
ncbi:MAG TPA: YpdA family putative bacillithiol disulfide reductase [Bacteroidota bacterium]|nr:YpdA family putative bacillithiol disulfide reductase [Bacteroidota bacterium]